MNWRSVNRDDLPALVELAKECVLADGGLTFITEPDDLEDRYFPDAPGAVIGAFATEGPLVACAAVHLARKSDTERVIIAGQVLPQLRNRGIGDYLIRWSLVQAKILFTADTVTKRLLQIATESLTEPAGRLYKVHGFERVFESLVMRRDLLLPLPDLPLPDDVTLTSWRPDLAEQFYQAYYPAFLNRPGFPGWSAEEWIAKVLANDFKPKWSLLARAGGVPLGFMIGTIDLSTDPPGGFLWQVGVIPEQRRRGIGSVLMVESMRRMLTDGALSNQLTVNVNNPEAIQTYDRLGFVTVGRRARYERVADES